MDAKPRLQYIMTPSFLTDDFFLNLSGTKQAITWINADVLSVTPYKIQFEIQKVSFVKCN